MFSLLTLAALPLPLLLAAPPQEPTVVPANPPVVTAPSEPKLPASERNVRVDVSVSVKGGDKVVAKSLSLVAADGRFVQGRAGVSLPVVMSTSTNPNIPPSVTYRDVGINVDASPKILPSGKISVSLKLNFSNVLQVTSAGGERASFGNGSHETNAIVFESGKPLVVLESADPESGRTYAVQVTATLLK